MTKRILTHFLFAFALGLFLAACGKSSTSPSTDAIADFITGITASDGSVAAAESGSPPAPNGGPTLTATSSGSVSSGGRDSVALQASSPIQTVYVSVNNSAGFYQVQLVAATTNITLSSQQASQLSGGSYTASYRASAPGTGGLVGNPTTVTDTVVSPGGGSTSTNFTGNWGAGGVTQFALTQSGSSVTGNEVFPAINVPGASVTFSAPVTGTVSGSTLTAQNPLTFVETITGFGTVTCTEPNSFIATLSGNTLAVTYTSGVVTCSTIGFTIPSGVVTTGTYTLTRQ